MKSALLNKIVLIIILIFAIPTLSQELEKQRQDIHKELQDTTKLKDMFTPKPEKDSLAEKSNPKEEYIKSISEQDLFLQVFGMTPPRLHGFMVKFFVDNKFFGDVEVMYDPAFTVFEFTSSRFQHYLDTLLVPEINEIVNNNNGRFNSNLLDSLKFNVDINESKYELRIGVPAEHKTLQRMSMRTVSEPQGELLEPAKYSFYLNAKTTDDFYYYQYSYEKGYEGNKFENYYNRMPSSFDLEGAIAYKGYVLEGSGYISEPSPGQKFNERNIRRNDFRIIRDYYSKSTRLSIGDVSANTGGGLMHSASMGGVRYEYDKNIFSGYNIDYESLYKVQFFLPKNSQVEIRINHRTARRLQLPAGYHEISGFSGVEGTNLVEIYITKEDGSLEIVPYEFLVGPARNLPKGDYRYSAAAGLRRSSSKMGYDYHITDPGISASMLYGLFMPLTIGIGAQSSLNNMSAGPQLIYTLNKSNFLEFKGLANLEEFKQGGTRAELQYSYRTNLLSYAINTYYQTDKYNPSLFNNLSGFVTNYAGLSASTSTRLLDGSISASAGLSLNNKVGQMPPVTKYYAVSLSQSIFRISLSASFSVSHYRNEWMPYASFGAGYSFGLDRHNFSLTNNGSVSSTTMDYDEYEVKDRSNLNWNWSNGGGGSGARSYSLGASVEKLDIKNGSLQFGARHSYNRSNINATYGLRSYYYDDITRLIHIVRADLGFSFMFADGLWAFGRPVSNGFILTGASKSLKGSTIHINYSDYHNTSFSSSGLLGVAYYNQISNYRPNEIRISLTDAPMGTWLEQNRYYAMGAYKQGYTVRLGSDANVLLQLTLLKEDGPLSYTYLTIDGRPTFTGNDGSLLMGNLKAGQKYIIDFGENSQLKNMEVIIPEDAGNFIELPNRTVEYK